MMQRREALALLLGSAVSLAATAPAAAVVIDVRTRRLIAVQNDRIAGARAVPPGSAVKPFALAALLRAGKLDAGEQLPCTRKVTIEGRVFDCSHPEPAAPVRVRTAIAYSCNCFVTHFAGRFAPGELTAAFDHAGLATRTGLLGEREASGEVRRADSRLQAIGEAGILVTPAALALAYARLADSAPAPIREGLEDAVEFGTAQRAQVAGVQVAGKTGSVRGPDGAFIAWFAGFAPSREPEIAVAVMLQGRSGGADAAPIGGELLATHLGRRR